MKRSSPDRSLDISRFENTVFPIQHINQRARHRGRSTGLIIDDMGRPVGNDLVTGRTVDCQRNLVAHRAGRQEDRIFLAKALRDLITQPIDTGIEPVLLIADLRLGHRLAHAGRRLRLGIAVEIDSHCFH